MEAKRVLIYSHDTYGLGHLRRSLLLAERLTRLPSRPRVLVATGSPRAQAFRLPQGCDTLKLPAVLKQSDGSYGPRSLGVGIDDLVALRSRILVGALEGFRPDLVLVDHAPLGMAGELGPVFDTVGRMARRPRVVLGLRDVIDDAAVVERAWSRDGVFEAIDRVYDEILVYGDPAILTTARELALDSRLSGRVHHVGYLGRRLDGAASEDKKGRLVVTGGGGGDAHRIFRAVVSWLRHRGCAVEEGCDIVAGPFLSRRRHDALARDIAELDGDVTLHDFVDDLGARMASASGVIAMAGYNTVVEVLSCGVPALLVPRSEPRREQTIRAERVAPVADLQVCGARTLDERCFETFLEAARAGRDRVAPALDLGGLDRAARILEACLEGHPEAASRAALHVAP